MGFLIFFLLIFVLWIVCLVWATKRNGVVGFLLTFFLGLLGAIIVACLASDEEQRERERERETTLLSSIAIFATLPTKKIY